MKLRDQSSALRISFLVLAFLLTKNLFCQYDAECFINTKKEIQVAIQEQPLDSLHYKDSLTIGNVTRYVDTVLRVYRADASPYFQKLVGCRLPDFNFFNLAGTDMSVNKIESDFSIFCFSSTTYGDVSNARLQQFCKLKTLLKDSLTVINIFEEKDSDVAEYSKNYESNVEYVANADLLFYHYSMQWGPVIYLLDKYKNIIYIKSGHKYNYTPDEIYGEILEKIRSTNCSD